MKIEAVVTNPQAVVMKIEAVVTNPQAVVMKIKAVVIYNVQIPNFDKSLGDITRFFPLQSSKNTKNH